MPRPLKHPVHQIDAGLAIVGTGQQFRSPEQAVQIAVIEAAQIDFHKVTETLVRK